MNSRYFYYLIALNMLVNVIMFIPKILIENRLDGAVMAILIAIPVGVAATFSFVWAINKFPGQGLLEILTTTKSPKWLSSMLLSYVTIIWYTAGLITLLSYTYIIERFINPDMDGVLIFLLLIILVIYGASSKTEKVLYIIEIGLIFIVPLAVIIFFKSIVSTSLSWDDIRAVSTHIWKVPNWSTIAAATYIFTGYVNMVIFNRLFKKKIKTWPILILPIFGFINLFTTMFLPIGFFGIDGIEAIQYPWIATSDTLRMEFGFIERVLFIFLLIYIVIALLSSIVHWHVGLEFAKSLFPVKNKENPKVTNGLLISFATAAFLIYFIVDEKQIYNFGKLWISIRMPSEYLIVLVLTLLAWRKAR